MYVILFIGKGGGRPSLGATAKSIFSLDYDEALSVSYTLKADLPDDELRPADGDIQENCIDFCFVFFMLGQLVGVDPF